MDNAGDEEKPRIKHVAIIGAGTMGCGIAQIAAQAGCLTSLTDENANVLQHSREIIENSVTRVASRKHPENAKDANEFITRTLKCLAIYQTSEETVNSADLVIEAIVEDLEAKKAVFAEIDRLAPDRTIFATNTSSLSVEDIAMATKSGRQFIGTHFFNPVPVMELVEVIQCSKTSSSTRSVVTEWLDSLGKTTAICKDTPGFVVNRLLIPMLMDAISMLEQGVATAENIDLAMKLGAAHPMGPLRLADHVGLDVIKSIVDGWCERYPEEQRFKPSPLLDRLVNEGKLGRKSEQGFFCYQSNKS